MRDRKRLAQIRKLPCIKCGQSPSQAAHSNFGEHGKCKSRKAGDKYTIPLCNSCHRWFDGYFQLTREQSKDWFDKMLEKTERMLKINNEDVF